MLYILYGMEFPLGISLSLYSRNSNSTSSPRAHTLGVTEQFQLELCLTASFTCFLHSLFYTKHKGSNPWHSLRETPETPKTLKGLGILVPRCTGFVAEHNSAVFVRQHWLSGHNVGVSGSLSQEVISSWQPVIYSKCLKELKRVSSGLELLVLADRCLHCLFFTKTTCLCYTGLRISLTFVLFTWRQLNNEIK